MSTMTSTYAAPPVSSIGRREAQAWLRKRLGYERLLALLREEYAAKRAGKSAAGHRGVAA